MDPSSNVPEGMIEGLDLGENELAVRAPHPGNSFLEALEASITLTNHPTSGPMAFEVIDEWMNNIKRLPKKGIDGNKPDAAVDSCFDEGGELIYAGEDAWAGILDDGPPGPCTAVMPVFSTSRIVAGGSITGDVFKCHLVAVADAIADGFYGDVVFSPLEMFQLGVIFPTGVCDYAQGDARRP